MRKRDVEVKLCCPRIDLYMNFAWCLFIIKNNEEEKKKKIGRIYLEEIRNMGKIYDEDKFSFYRLGGECVCLCV